MQAQSPRAKLRSLPGARKALGAAAVAASALAVAVAFADGSGDESSEPARDIYVVDVSEEHNTHYTLGTLAGAFGSADRIVAHGELGGHFQVAVATSPNAGFPLDGQSHIVIAAGDARAASTKNHSSKTGPCVSDPEFGTLCDMGGVEIAIGIPQDATTVEFDYRYFTSDFSPSEDPFQVFVRTPDGATNKIAQATLSSELGSKSGAQLAFSPHVRHVVWDARRWAGQVVTLQFRASDQKDHAHDGGALVDKLVVKGPPPDTTPPVVALEALPPFTATSARAVNGKASDDRALGSVIVHRDGEVAFGPVPLAGKDAEFSGHAELTEGPNTFVATATDAAGNEATSGQVTTIRDTIAPKPSFGRVDSTLTTAESVDIRYAVDEVYFRDGYFSADGRSFPLSGPTGTSSIPLEEGANVITLTAFDQAGNSATTEPQTVYRDSTGPEVTLDPLPDYTADVEIGVTGTAADAGSGLAEVWFVVNGTIVPAIEDIEVGGRYRASIPLAEGANTVELRARDRVGIEGSDADTVVQDGVAPVASIDDLPPYVDPGVDADGRQRPFRVTGRVSDSSPITAAAFVAGGVHVPVEPDSAGRVAADLFLGEGEHTIVLKATDAAGNTGGTSDETIVDRSAPELVVVSPESGQGFGETRVSVQIDVRDAIPATVDLEASTGAVDSFGPVAASPTLTRVSLSFEADAGQGTYSFTLTAADALGHSTSVGPIEVVVDLEAPVVGFDVPDGVELGPQPDDTLVGTLTVDDLSEVTVSGLPGGDIDLPAGHHVVSDAWVLAEGPQTIAVSATDPFGRRTDVVRSVTYDRSPPVGAFTSPAAGACTGGVVELGLEASDAYTGVVQVIYALESGGALELRPATLTGGVWLASFDTASFGSADWTVNATMVDRVGNSGTQELRFRSDNTDPVITTLQPAEGSYLAGVRTFAASATDDHCGVRSLTLTVGGESIATCEGSSCSATFDTRGLLDGAFSFAAVARDGAGNETTRGATAIADNSAPERFLLSPTRGEVVTSEVDVSVLVEDAHFASVECALDGVRLFASSEPAHSVSVSMLDRLDGEHIVRCVATDRAGNVGIEVATFQVRNWHFDLDPSTLNLKSAGGSSSVTLYVEGRNVAILIPIGSRALNLLVPGGAPVPATAHPASSSVADADGDGVPDLTVKFDRQALIASIKAGMAAGLISAGAPFRVDVRSGNHVMGSDTMTAK